MIPKFHLKIINKRWTIRFLPAKRFIKKHGSSTVAICFPYKKQIDFSQESVNIEDAAHELTHAYFEELCLGRAVGLKKDQYEEAFCELVSKHGMTLLVQALYIRSMYKKLLKVK